MSRHHGLGTAALRAWRLALIGLLLCLAAAPVRAEEAPRRASPALEAIRARGALAVGVKNDYPLFAAPDAAGRLRGLEIDMAAELAAALGVSLRLVPVTAANRLQRLEEGAVDMVIATMGDTAERRRVATVVEPSYYASGATLLLRPESRVRQWQELRGQTVCAVQGSYFNRGMSQRYLLQLLVFGNARDARLALRDGRCVGLLYDSTAIGADLRDPQWSFYQAPLPPAMPVPWVVALSRREAGSELAHWVGERLAQWHREGFLIERERAWGLAPSPFLADMRALWLAREPDGAWRCRRGPDGDWPAACRNKALLTVQDVGGLHRLGLRLRELTGWDLSFVYDDFDRGRLLRGLGVTTGLMAACVLGSLALGIAGALLAQSRWQLLAVPARAAALWSRMTPPLLQMYLLFFGAGAATWALWGLSLPAWAVAVWALSAYAGAAVMAALEEAARYLRERSPGFRLDRRSLALAYAHAAESITATLVNVCKATMIASAIAVPELLSAATGILADSGNVAEVMNLLMLAFLLLVAAAVRLLRALERRLCRLALRPQARASASAVEPSR
ncbi:transporter substrate-binding domain-containing protein [Ramlibacter rhizophilus]|uniref:Transporter substrate-binding domain-containing protein n=1 Tax=Ramlibacter rhizophilus TaxID=1781167 RepID=A0A4Z0BZ14_9BURK|nr:transporter substrate-binding domain-containing protein [Ramlibacter rhizophilus]TFZ03255.1 transporter substrate-binding domain-containing protein [Ramlibacter rhizophilus]